MSGTALEDQIAEAFEKNGFIVFKRKNHCDVLAVKSNTAVAYLVECKDYKLSRKQQILAVRELDRNYTHALEIFLENRLFAEKVLKILVAQAFAYQARGICQYTPTELLRHIQ